MMGIKERAFAPLVNVTLDDLVPADHFYRQVERSLDLSFVRDLVRHRYATMGRPSIDPVVFFKLQLVMFFEGIRSERQLERVASDRLSVRWYLGYDLHEPLPDHSSLTRIRDRYGVHIFRQFFEAIVERCRQAGLVWGKEVYADATLVEANADRDKMLPRFAVEQHLHDLFGTTYEPNSSAGLEQGGSPLEGADFAPSPIEPRPRVDIGTDLPPERASRLDALNATRHDWYARNGEPDRAIQRHGYQRMSDLWVSLTDRDAVLMQQHNHGVRLRYRDHYLVDGGKARIILGVLVSAADVMDNQPFLDMLWRACFRWPVWPRSATGDGRYGTLDIIRAVEDAGIRAYMPVKEGPQKAGRFGPQDFTYDAGTNTYTCPNGQILHRVSYNALAQAELYQANGAVCAACPVREQCTDSKDGRLIRRSIHEAYLERVRAYHKTAAYEKAYKKRKVWVEPLFGEAQQWHGLRRFRLRGLEKVNCEGVVTATGQNLKRLLAAGGWGRRWFPGGAPGVHLSLPSHVLCA
jgi:transposase